VPGNERIFRENDVSFLNELKAVPTGDIEGFPLSPQQKHLWSLQQIDDGPAYRAQCAVLIEGPLDPKILQAAAQQVFARNEILRTTFHCPQGSPLPLQIVGEAVPLSIGIRDMSDCGLEEQQAVIDALFREAGELRFDLETGPLAALSLVTFASARHVLLISLPSLCADASSLNNMVQEIAASYSFYLSAEEVSEPPLQYADLAQWQNELLASPEAAKARDYWRKSISDAGILRLAIENQIHKETSFVPIIQAIAIEYDIGAEIEASSRRYAISAPAFLLSCWQSLLWRLTDQSEFSIGVSAEARGYEGLQQALGLFAKSLPIAACTDGDPRFDELVRRVEKFICEAREWEEYFNWEQAIGPEADNGSHSFCDVVFEYRAGPAKASVSNSTFSICREYVCSDRFKLKLSCIEQEGKLHTQLHYDSNLFRAADIGRLGAQFLVLLKSAISNPQRAISELEMLDEDERERLLVEFSGSESSHLNDRCIHQLFEEQVERTPGEVALAFGKRHLTYAQLNWRANQVASYYAAWEWDRKYP
jgi:hypothetical protein